MTRREAMMMLAVGGWRLAGDPRPPTPSSPANRTSNANKAPTANRILTRPIPSSKETLPIIGLGTWQTFDVAGSEAARKPLADVLTQFVQLGGSVVDSSPMYGRAETVLGDLAVSLGVRNRLFMATKVWTTGRAEGIAQMADSERKLRGKVDLMQVHNLTDADTHLDTLRRWKSEGRVRYIGVTHYTSNAYLDVAEFIRRGGIDFVQINYSLAEREAERRLIPLAADRGIAVLVNRPLGAGSLFRDTRGKALPAFAKDLACTSWAELFLKFVVSHPAVTCAIPATSKVEHLRQNMNAGRGPMPDEAIRKRIAAAL